MEWISVEDRLPDDGAEVLACNLALVACDNGFGSRFVAWLDYDTAPPQWIVSGEEKEEVTHWMPLPEPPRDPSMPREFTENPLSVENVAKICGLGTITRPKL
jgi:hypothetical protein